MWSSWARGEAWISSNANQSIFQLMSVTRDSNSRGNPTRITSSCTWIETDSPNDINESNIFLIPWRNLEIISIPVFEVRSSVCSCFARTFIFEWKSWWIFSQSFQVWRQPITWDKIGGDRDALAKQGELVLQFPSGGRRILCRWGNQLLWHSSEVFMAWRKSDEAYAREELARSVWSQTRKYFPSSLFVILQENVERGTFAVTPQFSK